LAALVVLTLGLLAMAQLLVHGIRTSNGALLRTQAINLVADMAERIRANAEAGAAYHCASYPGGPALRGCSAAAAESHCDISEQAEDDLASWQVIVRGVLPGIGSDPCAADVSYTAASSPRDAARYRIRVSWLEPGAVLPLRHASEILIATPVDANRSLP
jgi:type IV pilus assembly protein PilV